MKNLEIKKIINKMGIEELIILSLLITEKLREDFPKDSSEESLFLKKDNKDLLELLENVSYIKKKVSSFYLKIVKELTNRI